MAVTIKGGPELRARLGALASSQMKVDMNRAWQDKTTQDSRAVAPSRTGRGRASITPGFVSDTKAYVKGAYWLLFIDRGTKKHTIYPKGISGSGRGGKSTNMLLISRHYAHGSRPAGKRGGGTIFGRKATVRGIRRRPFITEAAQRALRDGRMADQIVQTWNRKHVGRYTRTKAA